jgi:hypothetical protein
MPLDAGGLGGLRGRGRRARLSRLGQRQRVVFETAESWFRLRAPVLYRLHRSRCLGDGFAPFFAYPASANEKYLWRKLLDHDPRFVAVSDKLAARRWLAEQGIAAPMPEVLWVGTDPATMPADLLRDDVVIKTNHAYGHLHYVRDGIADRAALDAKIRGWLAYDHSRHRGQWAYRDIPRRVFLERVVGAPGQPLEDFKFHTCGDRVLRMARIYRARGISEGQMFFPDAAGDLRLSPRKPSVCDRYSDRSCPASFGAMTALARRIGAMFDHIRVDFLVSGDRFWLGELTVYNLSGFNAQGGADPDDPHSIAWDIRNTWFMREARLGPFWRLYRRHLREALDRWADAPSASGDD